MNKIKAALRKTPLFDPLKWLAAILGRSSHPLPFAHTLPAEPFLDRAIARIGHAPDPDRREEQFYSYFSEIWAEGYEQGLAQQYAAYLPHLPKGSDLPFLDIGCGAGEFVRFLDMHGIPARGIDSDATEVARAKERGLDVHHADAIGYLEAHQECFSGISLLEVIEHLPPESLAPLLSAIFRALAPGGLVLLETINVKNSLAFNTFYTDPTHTRPIPSDYLVFLVQWTGLSDVHIVYSAPMAFTREQALDPSKAYFVYAVLGSKPMVTSP
ncbi:class I SAM-dependent methyltransferase [Acidithiobacillus sp.]